ncbi:hypothetical protein C6497_04750 [Candidatus Poribacteria bacterium]|nr:MAG: hypothetical protein C6497_04750 [Candidatus Poribacteria bacterium]
MQIKSIYTWVFLFILCAIPFELVASSGNAPKLVFTSWKVGQSDLSGPYTSTTQTEDLSFLTNDETTCKLKVEVGYAADQPATSTGIDKTLQIPSISVVDQKQNPLL